MGVLAKDGSAQIPAELWPDSDETPPPPSLPEARPPSHPVLDPARVERALAFTPSDLVRVIRWA